MTKAPKQTAFNVMGDLLTKVTGQLAALQQANDTLVEKWRARAIPMFEHWRREGTHRAFEVNRAADELEAATKEATA